MHFLLLFCAATCHAGAVRRQFFGDNDIFNPATAFQKLVAIFTPTAVPLILDTFTYVPPVPLNPPGRIPSATLDDVRANFISAYMPFCPTEKIAGQDCICKETYPHVEFIDDTSADTLVLVAIHQKRRQIVVSYRITANLQNWIDNISLQLVDVVEMPSGVRVHRGIYDTFVASYHRVRASVTALLDDPRYANHTLLVTGYSLGGGLAQVATPSWVSLLRGRQDPRPVQVIAYANPRVGNRAFADYMAALEIPVTRYTNGNDLVSHLPGRKLGYVHAGAEVYGSSTMLEYSLRHCGQAFDEDPTCVLGSFATKSPIDHTFPFGKFIPLPPYCS